MEELKSEPSPTAEGLFHNPLPPLTQSQALAAVVAKSPFKVSLVIHPFTFATNSQWDTN